MKSEVKRVRGKIPVRSLRVSLFILTGVSCIQVTKLEQKRDLLPA